MRTILVVPQKSCSQNFGGDVRKVDIWTICIIQVILDCLGQYGPFWATLDHFYQKMWFPNTSLKILLGTFLGHPVVITM